MSLLRLIGLSFLTMAILSPLPAQKPAELKKSGEKYFANRRWPEALDALGQYQQLKPGDPAVLTKLGIVHYHLHQSDKALQFLDYVVKQNPETRDPDLIYYLARTLHGRQEFEPALSVYKNFLRLAPARHPLRANAADNILRCVSGQGATVNDAVALVENLGNRVNTPGDEFAPLPSVSHPDRLYFSAAREGNDGGRRNDDGYEDETAGRWCSDMFFTTQTAAGWDYAHPLGSLLNTPRHEVVLDISADGQVLYYFRGFTLYSGDVFADTAGRPDEYTAAPVPFASPMQTENGDTAPFFFDDSTLLFASRRPGGHGGLDLYVALRRDGVWQPAQNLGPAVNSAYDETTPFLARDGHTLYFSANHTGSIGGLDVFRVVFDPAEQTWSAPQNLGLPVNSPGDDAFFRLTADGRSAFLASDRLDDNLGERDIYMVYYKTPQNEQNPGSVRGLFADAGQRPRPDDDNAEPGTARLSPLFYTNDRDVLGAENLKTVETAAALARLYPDATVLVTAHTDETGPAKFDLYAGIKRAEIVGKALTDRGTPAGRVVLRSVGPAYPLARNVVGASPNPEGQRLNRRIEITLTAPGGLPLDIQVERPPVGEELAVEGTARLDALTEGLAYKVEFASTRQILASDAAAMFDGLMIETQPGAGSYRYTAGWSDRYADTGRLRQELKNQGFSEAVVIAYANGVRVSRAEAISLVKKYPDLAAFVRG